LPHSRFMRLWKSFSVKFINSLFILLKINNLYRNLAIWTGSSYTSLFMSVRIAIPVPTSIDTDYNTRALPPYLQALQSADATPILISLDDKPANVARILAKVQGVLLPGSKFDVDPQKYGAEKIPACNLADPAREAAEELLLQDAFNLHKPILAICYGIQSLNVWLNGTLIQDLAAENKTQVDHAPGRTVLEAHPIRITAGSLISRLAGGAVEDQVNSSHHQSLLIPGNNLRVTAVSPADEVIEAVELESPDHWVVGVQWHPERTYTTSALSRALFSAFVHVAEAWKPRAIHESVAAVQ
jgi:putative glutamine amidotransferase